MSGHPHQKPESSLFRSEDMTLLQLYIPTELAHPVVSELGELGLMQFRDLNPELNAFQRTFVSEIRRLDEMERRTRFLLGQCEKQGIRIKHVYEGIGTVRARTMQEIDDLDSRLVEIESRITQMNASQDTLNRRFLELSELKHVLRETAFVFDEARSRGVENITGSIDDEELLLGRNAAVDLESSPTPNFVAGVINTSRMITFERVLWRVLRGNLYMKYYAIDEPIQDPETEEPIKKNVFVVFAHGKEVIGKIKKISESLGATVYPVDGSAAKRAEHQLEVTARIEDLNNVIYNTNATRRAELLKVSEAVEQWLILIRKEKAIYLSMNLFNYDSTRKCLIAEGWCPTLSINAIQYSLHSACERSGSLVPPVMNELRTHLEPPTFHRTNRFTRVYQLIIDAYGIAKHKEVNPGLFTIITFPFLFAIMFGDFGHGAIMTLVAIYLIWNEKQLSKNKDEMFSMLFNGRYILVLMGLFSVYVGLIYNDIFSLSVYVSPSGWKAIESNSTIVRYQQVGTYPFGVDPTWNGAENMLLFLNSYKMKMAIIIGVIHMLFGICLTVYNSKYFHKEMNIYCEFIPQMLFMISIFGYLCILIIYKWLVRWDNQTPPGLLNTLIFMFLKPGTVDPKDQIYPGQGTVQAVLVLIALITVPWMLVIKPILLRKEHLQNVAAGYATVENESPGGDEPSTNRAEGEHGEKFEMGEIVVHQVIHTIEFCLGGISNTASYLRLWALSLAHAQLSEVLWDMTIETTVTMLPGLGLFVGYYLWFALTLGILLCMEGLSAFLHALRLHWVEFNSKFYAGTGHAFEPFSFSRILDDKDV